ncbi:MAG: amino acid racemase [Clostridia bacterium]|nr:amino acid racemase [Clostridia bacterium]
MKIGIVGGIGPESTVDYYKRTIHEYQKMKKDGSYPQIVVDSIDMKEMLYYIERKELSSLVNMLMSALKNLSNAGADFAVIASNTPHVVYDAVKELSSIPVLSIVEETAKKAKELNLKRVGLLGTAFTMKESFYKNGLLKYKIDIVVPDESEQATIHEKIFSELEMGIVKIETKNEFLKIIKRMIVEDSIEGLVLGCTELPLILKSGDSDVLILDTVEIHVQSIIRQIKNGLTQNR